MDPRMMNSMSEYGGGQMGYGEPMGYGGPPGYGDSRGYGERPGFGGPPGYGGEFGGGMSMEERMLERRAQRMYQDLAAKGQYGQIDKAKHSKNYRNYLLENYVDGDSYY